MKSTISRIRCDIYILDTNDRVLDKSRTVENKKNKKINTLSYIHTCR